MGNQHAIEPSGSAIPPLNQWQAHRRALRGDESQEQLDQLAPGLTEAEPPSSAEPCEARPSDKAPARFAYPGCPATQGAGAPQGFNLEDLFPRAYQILCEEKNFLFGTEARELAFIETHGRRWKAGEGIDYPALPTIPELRFDPANLEASCKMLHDVFDGISFPARPETLANYVRECHKAIHRERERRKTALRDQEEPMAYGIARQSYKAFAREGLVFVGDQVLFLATYIDLRSKGSGFRKAEQLVLARRRKKLSGTDRKNCKKVST